MILPHIMIIYKACQSMSVLHTIVMPDVEHCLSKITTCLDKNYLICSTVRANFDQVIFLLSHSLILFWHSQSIHPIIQDKLYSIYILEKVMSKCYFNIKKAIYSSQKWCMQHRNEALDKLRTHS